MVVSLEREMMNEETLRAWAQNELGFEAAGLRGLAALKFAMLQNGFEAPQALDDGQKKAIMAALPMAVPVETLTEMPVQSLVAERKGLKAVQFGALPSKA